MTSHTDLMSVAAEYGLRIFAALLLLIVAVQLIYALWIGILGARPPYLFTLPHLLLLATCLMALLFTALKRDTKPAGNVLTAILLAGTLLTYSYAGSRWPGGDDGGGMGWVFLVGMPSMFNVLAALVFVIVAAVQFVKRHRAMG